MDNAIVNVPLAKRGDIDRQIDAYKAEQKKLAKQENKQALRNGVLHLFRGDSPRVFSNMTQAQKAAERTGGEAYKDSLSSRFMVRFLADHQSQGN